MEAIGNEDDVKTGPGAVAAAAKGPEHITPAIAQTATDWFLSDEAEDVAWAWLPVNVAAAGQRERIVEFKIGVVERDRIDEIREEATVVSASGVRKVNEMEANLRIAVEGLLEPDIKGNPAMRKVRGQEFLDPGDALTARLAHKSGLIDQIAGKIVEISGYNDKDVKEVRAAGN